MRLEIRLGQMASGIGTSSSRVAAYVYSVINRIEDSHYGKPSDVDDAIKYFEMQVAKREKVNGFDFSTGLNYCKRLKESEISEEELIEIHSFFESMSLEACNYFDTARLSL